MGRDLEKLKLHDYKPLRDIVFEFLREAIIDGSLKPGQRVMEVQIAEKLGVSRTPVREAIRKLELEGLLIMEPRKGAYVGDVSFKDVLDVLKIRAALEGLAASLAAENATEEQIQLLQIKLQEFSECVKNDDVQGMIEKDSEFHDIILRSAKNEKLLTIIEGLRDQVQRFRVIYFTEFNKSAYITHEHQGVLEAISNRDSEIAREYAQQHIENMENYIVIHMKGKI